MQNREKSGRGRKKSSVGKQSRKTEISNLFNLGNSQRSQNITILNHDSSILERSAYYQAIKTWNSLNKEAKQVGIGLESFKVVVDAWLISKRDSDFVVNLINQCIVIFLFLM